MRAPPSGRSTKRRCPTMIDMHRRTFLAAAGAVAASPALGRVAP
ncbi:MAG: hypothetical protein E6G94_10705, partial [Alphaproteobacteria bacterium]